MSGARRESTRTRAGEQLGKTFRKRLWPYPIFWNQPADIVTEHRLGSGWEEFFESRLGQELSPYRPESRSQVRIPLEAWMFACVLWLPCVEAGKNTSTVIPASPKRRQKENPVVSGETVPADLREV
jgi:hypothetical protein